jgi:malate dehydrogenase (oxaloacetate-decarboxylating)(NADP+)
MPEGEDDTVLRAARQIIDQRIAKPVLLGRPDIIAGKLADVGLDLQSVEVVWPADSPDRQAYADELFNLRKRKGMTPGLAREQMADPTTFALMMVRMGAVHGFVGGMYKPYPDTIRPALQIVGLRDGVSRVSALHLLVLKHRLFFCADTMINIDPTAEELAEIAVLAADTATFFDVEPRVAMLAFSSFGSVRHPIAERVAKAVNLVTARRPDIIVDGEMHLDTAVVEEIVRANYPHSRIKGDANVLIFPALAAGNIGYKLVQRLGGAEAVGPVLMGMRRPVNVLAHGTTVTDIVNLTAITAVAAESHGALVPGGRAREPELVGPGRAKR